MQTETCMVSLVTITRPTKSNKQIANECLMPISFREKKKRMQFPNDGKVANSDIKFTLLSANVS